MKWNILSYSEVKKINSTPSSQVMVAVVYEFTTN